jgi:hypothetical protein
MTELLCIANIQEDDGAAILTAQYQTTTPPRSVVLKQDLPDLTLWSRYDTNQIERKNGQSPNEIANMR